MAVKRKAPKLAARLVIADAGPLIALAKVKRLGVLKRLFGGVFITPEVAHELQIGSTAPGALLLTQALRGGTLALLPGNVKPAPHPFLDAGEASCLAAATPNSLLLIDERLGRREAAKFGIAVAGTAGVLCSAKARGFIKKVVPILEKMRAEGYYLGDEVIELARRQAGE